MAGRPFSRHVALHLSVQRCLNGPRRYEMSTSNWPGIDDAEPPVNQAFSEAVGCYKEHMAYAMTTSTFLRLRPTIIRLPQGLPREHYVRLGECLDANLGSFDMEVYGTLVLIAIRPNSGLIPFTALREAGWTYDQVFNVAGQFPNDESELETVEIEPEHLKCALDPGELGQVCPVCLDEIVEGGGKLKCGHCFHAQCVARWSRDRSGTCPVCRVKLNVADYPLKSKKKEEEGGGKGPVGNKAKLGEASSSG